MQNENYKNNKNRIGISCFSVNPKNILMWSHYANSHKGIVYKFDTNLFNDNKDKKFINKAIKVNYSKNNGYELLNYAIVDNEDSKQYVYELITKAKDWEYEQEYRYIDINTTIGQGRNKKFNKQSLKMIIFGTKTSEEEKNKIKDLCMQHGFRHVQFKQARFKNASFDLEIINN